jgi:hypothetical protein
MTQVRFVIIDVYYMIKFEGFLVTAVGVEKQ